MFNISVRVVYFVLDSFSLWLNAFQPCTPISTLPVIINKPGAYCLEKDFIYRDEMNAITINASNVILNLKAHKIEFLPHDRSNRIYGIYSSNAHDIIIRNGMIIGFMYGIYLSDQKFSNTDWNSHSGNYTIERMILNNNFFRGIRVEGINQLIKNNQILNTGGSTVYKNAFSMGIEIIGPKATVENNSIIDTYAQGTGESVAISFSNNCADSKVWGNKIINHYKMFDKKAHYRSEFKHSFGIWVGGNEQVPSVVNVKNNRIKNMYYGISFSSPTRGIFGENKMIDVKQELNINSK